MRSLSLMSALICLIALSSPIHARERLEPSILDCSFPNLSGASLGSSPSRQLVVLFDRYKDGEQVSYQLDTADPTNLLGMGDLRFFDFHMDTQTDSPVFTVRSSEVSRNQYVLIATSRSPKAYEGKDGARIEVLLGILVDQTVPTRQPPLSGWCIHLHESWVLEYFKSVKEVRARPK
jgi:hypothetical protein